MLYHHNSVPSLSEPKALSTAPPADALATSCSHILVPTELSNDEAPAITMAWELARARKARLTLLHVMTLHPAPQPETPLANSWHWLEGIDRLHAGLNQLPLRRAAQLRTLHNEVQSRREQLSTFCERQIPSRIRLQTDIRLEVRPGDVAAEVQIFVAAEAVDLVILTSRLSWWRLPVVPARTHRLLQGLNARFIVVSPETAAGDEKRNRQTQVVADRSLSRARTP